MATAATKSSNHGHVLSDWRPEDPDFWAKEGKAIATRNLWISIPNLLLAFSVWMVWSVVVAKMPAIGFDFSCNKGQTHTEFSTKALLVFDRWLRKIDQGRCVDVDVKKYK